jgi:hypothetical protein
MVVAARCEAMMVLVFLTGRKEWRWVCGLPWMVWLWRGLGIAWSGLGKHPLYCVVGQLWEEASRWALIGLGAVWLGQHLSVLGDQASYGLSTCGAGMGIAVHVPKIEEGGGWDRAVHLMGAQRVPLHEPDARGEQDDRLPLGQRRRA